MCLQELQSQYWLQNRWDVEYLTFCRIANPDFLDYLQNSWCIEGSSPIFAYMVLQ